MRIISLIVLLLLAWWVGASGLFTMEDASDLVRSADEQLESEG
jgi:hypothetical protein